MLPATANLPFAPTEDDLPYDDADVDQAAEQGVLLAPTEDDLPYDDGEPVESHKHRLQQALSTDPLERRWAGRNDCFIGANQALYYSALQEKRNDFRAPDVMIMLDVPHRTRKSWVIWQEDGKGPDLVIEFLSPTTEAVDRGDKMRIYETVLKIPEYFLYSPDSGLLEGYRLATKKGRLAYERLQPDAHERLASEILGLHLGVWNGIYQGYEGPWLRWYTPEGTLLATPQEAEAEAEQKRTEAEQKRTEAEQKRTEAEQRNQNLQERLAAYERAFGPLPDPRV